ncbi:hypothetical protein ACFSHQ_13345 [Gemmobacter lanyuensis]
MSQENEQLAEAIRNALAAAEAATDAAAEAAAAIEGQLRGTEALQKAQRRLGVLTIAATGGALLSVAVSALVYFRSVADLREASELQAAATGPGCRNSAISTNWSVGWMSPKWRRRPIWKTCVPMF